MTDFYFVVSALPPLVLGEPPDISFAQVLALLQMNLSEAEMRSVRVLQRLVDVYNLAALWRGEPFDPHGSLAHHDLEDALSSGAGLPGYIYDHIQLYDSNQARLHNFGRLAELFFQEELPKARGFLHAYLEFERDWRLVLLAFRVKEFGRDVAKELQYEEPTDDLVAQIIAQRDAKTFEPPQRFGALRSIFHDNRDDPRRLQQALDAYRFRRVQEMVVDLIFTLDWVLGYTVRLMIVDKQQELELAYG